MNVQHEMVQILKLQLEMLEELRLELVEIRLSLANEPDPDAEPDPFQTLNGPVKKSTGCGAQLAIEGWGGFCGETDMGQTLPTLCVDCGGPFQTLNGPKYKDEASELFIRPDGIESIFGMKPRE